ILLLVAISGMGASASAQLMSSMQSPVKPTPPSLEQTMHARMMVMENEKKAAEVESVVAAETTAGDVVAVENPEKALMALPSKLPEVPSGIWGVIQKTPSLASVLSRIKIPGKYDVTKIGDRGVGGGMNFYSLEKETALGRDLSAEVEQNARLFHDEQVNEYVNRIAQNLVRNSDAKVPFTVKIIDNDEVNAMALPGGFFYVNVGLLMAAESEAELAGVMAHEVAHVAARHATKNASKKDLWNILSIPLVFVGGPAGMIVQNVANIAVPMSFLKFGRNAEREADLLGLEYQYAAGYDPSAMVSFFERIGKGEKKKNFLARAFSTHPMNEDRIKRSQKTMQTLLPPAEEYLITTSDFEEMKARLAKLTQARLRIGGESGSEKPTLRKKTESSSENEDGPPVLKRKD
ncbi:MAG TPA: M48 family metallopeptidase, partial [Terriglobales bacterium]|nr:M48 family metallopeptidase [Terriglobales bacterium]